MTPKVYLRPPYMHVCTYMSTHTWPPPQMATSTYTTQRHFRILKPIAGHTTMVTFETLLSRLALEKSNFSVLQLYNTAVSWDAQFQQLQPPDDSKGAT